ncbi:MAG: hypothetical protein COS11_00260 [bacterium (Candidatus Ratteibacteria) CG01_land_8_20_14_3_00_40_19]|uniref:Uncharacterized protein n=3 Tax=Candidatus Ratteibacteria TaxID=2979319 RepID=A0A2M7EAR1_9BACT|nr:MAG: hypothetical protein COS11_00260 [bacterium (Candidatus Ratteibacteria) CG01_land_8_20_14_3_00_40_19]PIW73815.1 MAG: hypothetical protein CO004_03980 [bacterium (Candidatus Ratteibacteria) CG_4_8_14_3_um_filter_41_36]
MIRVSEFREGHYITTEGGDNMKTLINQEKDEMKELLKGAMINAFEERQDMFYGLFVEAIEDMALAKVIKESEKTKSVSRNDIFKILKS